MHVSDIVSRGHKRALAIHRCFTSRDVNTLLHAYIVYVRPLVEHNSVIWSPITLRDTDANASVERRFTKRLPYPIVALLPLPWAPLGHSAPHPSHSVPRGKIFGFTATESGGIATGPRGGRTPRFFGGTDCKRMPGMQKTSKQRSACMCSAKTEWQKILITSQLVDVSRRLVTLQCYFNL